MQGIGVVLLQTAVFVAGAALWPWWRYSTTSSDFVTGAVFRRVARLQILQVQHFVNLDVQTSWQAQRHFVNLDVQIS